MRNREIKDGKLDHGEEENQTFWYLIHGRNIPLQEEKMKIMKETRGELKMGKTKPELWFGIY